MSGLTKLYNLASDVLHRIEQKIENYGKLYNIRDKISTIAEYTLKFLDEYGELLHAEALEPEDVLFWAGRAAEDLEQAIRSIDKLAEIVSNVDEKLARSLREVEDALRELREKTYDIWRECGREYRTGGSEAFFTCVRRKLSEIDSSAEELARKLSEKFRQVLSTLV